LKFLSKRRTINDAVAADVDGQSTHRGYKTDRKASKSLDFTFSREMTGGDEASCAGSRERRVLNIFESRQKK
jgi:hypothetical protein